MADARPQLLLVDDDEDQRFLLRRVLNKFAADYQIEVLEDGEKALAWLEACARGERSWPFLVMLDLRMPPVNGFEVLEWAGRNGALEHSGFVVLSSSSSPHDFAQARQAGAHGYVCKVDHARIETMLRALSPRCTEAEVVAVLARFWPDH